MSCVRVLVLQAICEREGDRRDGAETDGTLLRRGAIQRTQSLQVIHFHCMLKWSALINLLVLLCILYLHRGKLISTILDWEDALPDRDLNKADDASRWDGRNYSNICFIVYIIGKLSENLLSVSVCTKVCINVYISPPLCRCICLVSRSQKLLLFVIMFHLVGLSVTHKCWIVTISITKRRFGAQSIWPLSYLCETGQLKTCSFTVTKMWQRIAS